ncbi:MAG: biotin--[acetyl-CoA-carboxylase] ligase [Pseudomonadota bacterium]
MQPADALRRELGAETSALVDDIDVFDLIDSTNSYLMRSPAPAAGRCRLALADDQSHGRGRHDRRWETAPGSCLCLSLSYTFEQAPERLAVLTLLMGVATARVLRRFGVHKVQLKWPNDIVVADSKLGGLLAETQVKTDRRVTVVAGIGVNLRLPEDLKIQSSSAWAQAATDLASCLDSPPARDALAARISEALIAAFRDVESGDIGTALGEWRSYDWLLGRSIRVDDAGVTQHGTAAGIDDEGLLLLDTQAGQKRIIAGTISLEDAG